MSLGLEGKVAIVTGSGETVGKQIAMTLAAEGARVVINDIFPEKVERTVAEFKAKGHQALGITADVTVYKQVEAMVGQVIKDLGRIDILVNNVGIAWGQYGPKGRGWFYDTGHLLRVTGGFPQILEYSSGAIPGQGSSD